VILNAVLCSVRCPQRIGFSDVAVRNPLRTADATARKKNSAERLARPG